MRKTAKSLIATLLMLVMLLSSVVVFSVSGIAAEAQESYQFNPTTFYNYSGSTVKMDGHDFTTVSANGTAMNLFFYDDEMCSISPFTYENGVFTQAPSVNIGLSFTLSTTGSENLPNFKMRLSGRNSTNSSTTYSPEIINFDSSVKVLGTEICGYGDGQEHDIYLDINIASFQTASSNGSLTVTVFVDGEYLWEKTASHSMYALKHDGAEQVMQFTGTLTKDGSDAILKDLTCYVNMPKAKPLTGKAPTGAHNAMGGYALTMKTVDGKNQFVYGSTKEAGDSVCAFFQGVSELSNLRGHTGTDLDVSKLGMSFTVEGTTSADGKYPEYGIRLYRNGSYNYNLISFTSAGGIGIFDSKNVVASLADGPVSMYLDVDITWASAQGAKDGSITVRAYVDGVYRGEFTRVFTMSETKRETGENALQFYASANITSTDGTNTFSNVEFYFGETADSFAGASMRLTESAQSSGLRFTFGVDKTFFDSFGGKATVGALIIPTDKLTNGHFSETELASLTKNVDYVEMTDIGFNENAIEADADTYVYYASIVNLMDQNYARTFTGVGFVELADGRRVYTCQQSRSIYEVAKNATASGDYVGTENAGKIAAYLDKVVSLSSNFSVKAIDNYACELVGAASGEGFTITGAGVNKITTIILNGEIYTDGWTVEGNVLTVAKYTAE